MTGRDPVKRGLNGYLYCENDPVDYVDPTGEIANILAGGLAGGIIGGVSGFAGSALSQIIGGKKFSWRKAAGSAFNGAVVGAVRGALVSSGAGFAASLVSNFAAGAVGNALEQKFGRGSVNLRESITGGLINAVSGAIYGNGPLKNGWNALWRGAASGAATAAINNLTNALDARNAGYESSAGAEFLTGMAGRWMLPYAKGRAPRTICGVPSPFTGSIGYRTVYGYQYGKSHGGGRAERPQTKKGGFSLGGSSRM